MNKFIFAIVILSTTAVIAEMPLDFGEIDTTCMIKYGITDEDMAKVAVLQFEDTPDMRSFVWCSIEGKHICTLNGEFDADRLRLALASDLHIDCNDDIIRECGDKYKTTKPGADMHFEILKCIGENQEGNCKKID